MKSHNEKFYTSGRRISSVVENSEIHEEEGRQDFRNKSQKLSDLMRFKRRNPDEYSEDEE